MASRPWEKPEPAPRSAAQVVRPWILGKVPPQPRAEPIQKAADDGPASAVEQQVNNEETPSPPEAPTPSPEPAESGMLGIALSYIARGWNPVPIGYRLKGPTANGWQSRVISADNAAQYFNGARMNIGVILGASSHGLTDVDLDCPEAVALASFVLPKTGAIFGRASSRAAHRLYVTNLGANAEKAVANFSDPTTKERLLELRTGGAKGAQTVFPGSTHKETGEEITWDALGEPASVDDDDLAGC